MTTPRPLRVLMVCARYLPDLGGIETHVDEVAGRLAIRDDFEITVLATDRTRSLPRDQLREGRCERARGAVRVLRVPAWPRGRDYYLAPGVARVVGRASEWDLVHCQGIHTPVPVLAMLSARRAGIPYAVTFHTGGHSLAHRNALRSVQWRALGPLLRRAEALIGVSRFEAELVSGLAGLDTTNRRDRTEGTVGLGRSWLSVIRNGGTLPAPSAGVRPVPGRILSSGRLERYKGHHRVIEALPEVLKAVPEAHAVVLGTGPFEPELRALAERIGVRDRVTITHLLPADRQAMSTALAQAHVVAALSDYEAHPVAVMEALSLGRPVVGYDIAGIGDLVAAGWVSGVAPGASPPEVAGQLVAAMSAGSRVDPARLPTWESCAEQLAQVYLGVARGLGCGVAAT